MAIGDAKPRGGSFRSSLPEGKSSSTLKAKQEQRQRLERERLTKEKRFFRGSSKER